MTLWPTIWTPHPETEILVFCLNTLPFCAVIVVGMISGCGHRFVFAVSAECGPVGRLSVKLETGASGVEAKVAGPFMGVGSTGVTAVALPTVASGPQPSGFASNVAARHAF